MRILLTVLAFHLALFGQNGSLSKIAFTDSKHVVPAFAASGQKSLSAMRQQVRISYSGGKTETLNLVVIHDPESGVFFWSPSHGVSGKRPIVDHLTSIELGTEAIYVDEVSLTDFNMIRNLWVKVYRSRVRDLDLAQSASLEEMRGLLPSYEKQGLFSDHEEVPLAKAIGTEFFCGKLGDPDFTGLCQDRTKIVTIAHDGENWRLVFRNHWDQEIVLDSGFKLVSTRRVPAIAKEAK